MRLLNINLVLALFAAFQTVPAKASAATLTAIGDLDRLSIGQAGFCGARAEVGASDWKKVTLKGDEQVWFFANSQYRTPTATYICDLEGTFIPASSKAYILRVTHAPKACNFELFRVVPGADPVPEDVLVPAPKSCALQ
jgi:hypothetical protein